ncbi:MAG: hypothetical protein A3E01_03670 [Gammaproteobacteria bacterium RIFCSPHIGHO2_12_FULL_63_22]|nr:MAG: hypothetical protein A3E01_03670 [Gammaproteobacteria bacterium RIFCSPHIGHO2_12_FULL_63_22]
MRKTNLFAMAAVMALFASPLLASDKADSAQACWLPAFEAGDADAVSQCYAPDAVLWLGGMPLMQGRDAIREGYAGFFSGFSVKDVKLVEMGHSSRGDEATGWGTYSMVLVSKEDGTETLSTGRYTDVSRKVDGKWMYVVDHASENPAAAAEAAPAPDASADG